MVAEVGSSSIALRADYIAIQDDMPEGWSLNTVLSYVGLNILTGGQGKSKSPPPTATNPDGSKLSFGDLPNARAGMLLATYDWVNANKLFCHNFLNYQAEDNKGIILSAFHSLVNNLIADPTLHRIPYFYLPLLDQLPPPPRSPLRPLHSLRQSKPDRSASFPRGPLSI